jgi:ribosomal protein L31
MNKKPLLKPFKIILTNGSTYTTNWMLPKTNLRTDIDNTVHPIWSSSKGVTMTEHKGRISTFQKRFGALSLDDEN